MDLSAGIMDQFIMKPINFIKYYLLFSFWDIFAGFRLLNTLHLLPAIIPFSPKIRMFVGIVILVCFFSMLFIDWFTHRDIQKLNTDKRLWIMLGIGCILQLTAGLIQDMNTMPV